MQEASSGLIDQFPDFWARLPAEVKVEELARQTGVFGRPRGVRSGTDLLRLALAWGPAGIRCNGLRPGRANWGLPN